ncbi:MAG: N-acetylglucosamine-6-phosphate deacetylase [Clostridia bacterium]|nr:N-acetylglucosamine-6-phosphate deacetylase [Clostridia bacterium]
MSLQYIINGRILLPDDTVEGKALAFDPITGRIEGLVDAPPKGADCIDAQGLYVSPGLVDLHIHGYLGADTCDADPEGLRRMARGIVQNGVTSFLPTTMTVSEEEIRASLDAVRSVLEESRTWEGAEILGVHAEGPFINPRKKGAQAQENIQVPNADFVLQNADVLRAITLAPEMDEGHACIRRLAKESGILLSMGHTDATFEQAMDAVSDGIRHATHLFNAMSPMTHRAPGAAGAALLASGVSVELIADTFHVHPGLYSLVERLKGEDLILVTDCTRAGGMPDGEYTLGGQAIFLSGIECRLSDGTIAGSVLKLNEAVRNVREHTSLPLHTVVRMASLRPARAIGEDGRIGSLESGKDADILLADESFRVYRTIKKGRTVYQA